MARSKKREGLGLLHRTQALDKSGKVNQARSYSLVQYAQHLGLHSEDSLILRVDEVGTSSEMVGGEKL